MLRPDQHGLDADEVGALDALVHFLAVVGKPEAHGNAPLVEQRADVVAPKPHAESTRFEPHLRLRPRLAAAGSGRIGIGVEAHAALEVGQRLEGNTPLKGPFVESHAASPRYAAGPKMAPTMRL